MNDFSRPRPGKSPRRSLRPCPLTVYPSDRFEIQIGAARLIRNMRWTCALSRALVPSMGQQTKDPDLLNVLVLERVDRTKNMARYYVLSVEPTLFAESSLVRRWGRIGGAGRTRIDLHASPPLAHIALNTWLERKRRRGYRLRA